MKVAVIGLGLIGGSLALDIKKAWLSNFTVLFSVDAVLKLLKPTPETNSMLDVKSNPNNNNIFVFAVMFILPKMNCVYWRDVIFKMLFISFYQCFIYNFKFHNDVTKSNGNHEKLC